MQLQVVDHDLSLEEGSDNGDQEFWRFLVPNTKTLDIRTCQMFKEIPEENPFIYDLQAVTRGKRDSDLIKERLLKYFAILSKFIDSYLQAVIDG